MDYESFRHFADSWGLLYLLMLFVGAIAFTFRPGTKETARRMAELPLKEDDENV